MQEGDLTPVTTDVIDELAAEMAGNTRKLKKLDCNGEYDGVSSHLTAVRSHCFVWPTANMNEIELLRNSRKHHGKDVWIPSFVGEVDLVCVHT